MIPMILMSNGNGFIPLVSIATDLTRGYYNKWDMS